MHNNNSKKRYYRRIKERYLWVKLGWPFFVFGFFCIVISVLMVFFDIDFFVVKVVSSIGYGGIILGGFSMVLFGQLGWSESKSIDFLLNRLGVVLIITSQVFIVIQLILEHSFDTIQKYSFVTIVGIVLILLGMFFHPPVDDS